MICSGTLAVVEPQVAVTEVLPTAIAWSNPTDPAVLLTVASPVSALLQVAWLDRSCVVWSEKVPIATS